MTTTPASDTAAAADSRLGPPPQRCVRHPNRETLVSCGRCGRPFCPDCLVHTPAGQRCYECAGVRRHAAGADASSALLKGLGVVVLGAAIGSITGLMGLLVGAVTGDIAGRAVGPSVNRHTRKVLYPLCFVGVLVGTMLGWTLPLLVRLMAGGAGRLGGADLAFVLVAIPASLMHSVTFWLFVVIVAAVGYQRVR
jgi:hypothetical protein